jgi:hypothetical protein
MKNHWVVHSSFCVREFHAFRGKHTAESLSCWQEESIEASVASSKDIVFFVLVLRGKANIFAIL